MSKCKVPPIIIRKSVSVLLLRLVILQIVVFVAYGVMRLTKTAIFSTAEPLGTSEGERLWLGVVTFSGLLLVQTAVFGYAILEWFHNLYELRPGSITHAWGVVSRREEVFSLQNIEAGKVKQDVIGRFLGFGTASFYSPVLKKEYELNDIGDPHEMKDVILKLIGQPRGVDEKIIPLAGNDNRSAV